MAELTRLKGTNGIVIVYNDRVEISRKSFGGFSAQGGLVGERTYLYGNLASVEYKKPSVMANGYIKFIVAGTSSIDAKVSIARGTSQESFQDQNTVVLRAFKKEVPKQSEELYNLIMQKIAEFNRPTPVADAAPVAQPTASTADELLKLKSLLDAGVLTQAEFDSPKAKLLQ